MKIFKHALLVATLITFSINITLAWDLDKYDDIPDDSWDIGTYDNLENETRELKVDHAESLKVTLQGETEYKSDIIVIEDKRGVKKIFSGKLEYSFEVPGDSIQVTFMSDASTVKDGAYITVEGALPNTAKWHTGAYINNTDINKTLSIKNTHFDPWMEYDTIEIKIIGETEKDHDILTIIDNATKKEIFKGSGKLNKSIYIPMSSESVTVRLTSNDTITKSGVEVSLEASYDPEYNRPHY